MATSSSAHLLFGRDHGVDIIGAEDPIQDADLALACVLARPDGGRRARAAARALLAAGELASDPDACAALGRVSATRGWLSRAGWRFAAAGDGLPPLLEALADPPLGLFLRGGLPDGPTAAVVGSRRASTYGREVAEHLGRELAAAGVWVVSGMARGVDAAAHSGALSGGGRTIAVWGTGPDRVYPAEHARLADEIAAGGGLVTEYPPHTPPRPSHFPERNRLIAGLSRVVVVVEADERSGALVTARLALEEGREVMAVPGSIFSRLSAGPNGLLRSGAAPVLSARDVLDVLGVGPGPPAPVLAHPLLERWPAGEALTADAVAALAGVPIAAALETLLDLEVAGALTREADGRYRRAHTAPLPAGPTG